MPAPSKIALSEHTLDVNVRRVDVTKFDFSEVEEYVRALAGGRRYQFDAIKRLLIYLWGGRYTSLKELAEENYRRKPAIQQRFHSEEHFLRLLPMPDKLSGVCHLATGTGKSYIMFGIAYLSLLLGKTKRVLVLGPASTIIEQGLREKFEAYLYGEEGKKLRQYLPAELRHKTFKLLTCNDPIEDGSIVIENINAVYNQERNSLGDTLFLGNDEVLVLSDEVHHAYTHLSFSGDAMAYDFEEGKEGKGEDRDERLWMKFLREEKRIHRHIGFTGTPYNLDDYFVDVLYNYSIKDAIDEKFIKRINPIIKTESDEGDVELTLYQNFQRILQTHIDNRMKFSYGRNGGRQVKPITVFINPTQTTAQKNTEAFIQVLADYLQQKIHASQSVPRSVFEEKARAQVICVISKSGDAETQQKLHEIEEIDHEKPGGLVEFIFAVNKLSEGWDVDNVFQIVPMEERVFNSKLLISQVLGRGLRLPRKVTSADIQLNYPVVTITNHQKFADHIKELLDQVTKCETRFFSRPMEARDQERSRYHFHLFNLKYIPHEKIVEREPSETDPSISKTLILHPSPEKLGLKVTYLEGTKRFELAKEYVTFDQMVLDIERRFSNWTFEHTHFDFGDGQVVDDVPGRKDIEQVIRTAMNEAGIEGDQLSLDNKKQIELFFNQYLPKGRKKVERTLMAGEPVGIATQSMRESSVRSGGLDQEASLFISEDYETELDESNRFVLNEVLKQDRQLELDQQWLTYQESYNKDYIRQLCSFKNFYAVNTSLFRSPQELVILSHTPEREFLFRLIEHGKQLDGWVKAPDSDFYSIDYEYWKKGRDRVRRSFNPDFFVRLNLDHYLSELGNNVSATAQSRLREFQNQGIEELILVVEIKHDDDQSEETRAKEAHGITHFGTVNQRLRETNPINLAPEFRESANQLYIFSLLRPREYPGWFSRLRTGLIVFDARVSREEDEQPVTENGETFHDIADKIRATVQEDWGENVLPREIMEAVFSRIAKEGPSTRIRFADMADLIGHTAPDKEIEQAALYLASNRVGMLNLAFEWIHDDGSSEAIPLQEVYRSLQAGTMANPRTGVDDPEFKSRIQLFFEPSTQLQGRKHG